MSAVHNRLRRAFGLAAAALVLPFTLSACGDALENAAENAAEEAAENAIEDGASGDVDIDIDDGEVKIENSDGAYVAGAGLPEDFPEDDVPIVGDVKYGTRTQDGDTQGWTVSTQVDGSAEDAYDEASSKLEDAGFESQQGSASYAGFKSDKYQVVLSISDDQAGGAILSYIVANAE